MHATQNSTPTAGESTQDPAYVGRAAGASPDSTGHTLLPRRAREHAKGIKSAKKKIAGAARNDRPATTADMDSRGMKQNKLGWYYEQLADASLGAVRRTVNPFFDRVQSENYFLHLDFLLALAEFIDAVFLGILYAGTSWLRCPCTLQRQRLSFQRAVSLTVPRMHEVDSDDF